MAFGNKIRLTEAAEIVGVSVGSLRKERDKGRLVIWRVAGKDWTSLEEIERMFDQCQNKKKAQGSGSSQHTPTSTATNTKLSGSSETSADTQRALDAALATVRGLRKSSRNTSSPSISQTGAEVVPLHR